MVQFGKILSNTAVQIAGKVFNLLVSIALVKLLSTQLGIAGYGYYVTIFEFVAIFLALADFGIFTMAVRELSACEADRVEQIVGNVFGMQIVMAVCCILLTGFTAMAIPAYQDTPIVLGVWLGTTTLLFRMLCRPLKAVLQVRYEMRLSIWAEVVGKLGKLSWVAIMLVPAVQAGYLDALPESVIEASMAISPNVIYVVVLGSLVGIVIQFWMTLIYARRYVQVSVRFDLGYWRDFMRRTLPFGVAIVIGGAYFRIDVLLLSILREPADVGVYAVAMRLIESASFLPVLFANALLPAMTSAYAARDWSEVSSLLERGWLLLLGCALPLVALSVIFATPLTLLLSSSDFLSGNQLRWGSEVAIQLGIWTLLFLFLNRLFVFASVAMEGQRRVLWVNTVGFVLNLVANLLLIPRYGIVAAALTTTISAAVVLVLNFIAVRSTLRFVPPLVPSLVLIGLAVLVFGACWILFVTLYDAESLVAMLVLSVVSAACYLLAVGLTVLRPYLPPRWRLRPRGGN